MWRISWCIYWVYLIYDFWIILLVFKWPKEGVLIWVFCVWMGIFINELDSLKSGVLLLLLFCRYFHLFVPIQNVSSVIKLYKLKNNLLFELEFCCFLLFVLVAPIVTYVPVCCYVINSHHSTARWWLEPVHRQWHCITDSQMVTYPQTQWHHLAAMTLAANDVIGMKPCWPSRAHVQLSLAVAPLKRWCMPRVRKS